jgi:bacteriorhodopsin
MGNKALGDNPPTADLNITTHGSDWLWAVFCVFTASLLMMLCLDFRRPRGSRLFHQIAIIVLTTGSLAYFSMASDLGATPVRVEFRSDYTNETRQIWYVRYIEWFINFPLLLLELLLATGLSLSDTMTTMFMATVLIVTGLVGALVPSVYKWGYFSFGGAALVYVWYTLLWHAPRTTFAAGGVLRSGYIRSACYFSFLLILYPIAWACSEGANVIKPNSEMIWYGILDIFAGPVFLFLFLYHLRNADYKAFGFHLDEYTDDDGVVSEKAAEAGMAPAQAA